MDFALNNLQKLICYKTQPTKNNVQSPQCGSKMLNVKPSAIRTLNP